MGTAFFLLVAVLAIIATKKGYFHNFYLAMTGGWKV